MSNYLLDLWLGILIKNLALQVYCNLCDSLIIYWVALECGVFYLKGFSPCISCVVRFVFVFGSCYYLFVNVHLNL